MSKFQKYLDGEIVVTRDGEAVKHIENHAENDVCIKCPKCDTPAEVTNTRIVDNIEYGIYKCPRCSNIFYNRTDGYKGGKQLTVVKVGIAIMFILIAVSILAVAMFSR